MSVGGHAPAEHEFGGVAIDGLALSVGMAMRAMRFMSRSAPVRAVASARSTATMCRFAPANVSPCATYSATSSPVASWMAKRCLMRFTSTGASGHP
jgi:hypothetical protein